MLKSATTSLAVLLAAAVFPASALAGTAVETYSTPGETPFVVPQGVNQIHIDAFGASGGSTGAAGGAGAEVQGDLAVTPGQTLFLDVGVGGGPAAKGGAGGGETDVRLCSASASSCSVSGFGSATSAQTRILVAGGGGGASYGASISAANPGGDAGLLNGTGADGTGLYSSGGAGAAIDHPGQGGASDQDPGPGDTGDTYGVGTGGAAGFGGGGGGAGYHGGGGGGGEFKFNGGGGGGGGSSWVNQDLNGIDGYLTHVTGASSSLSIGGARILITYSDGIAPALSLARPSDGQQWGARPDFGGTAGTDHGDDPNVAIAVYRGQGAIGSPVQTLSAPVDAANRSFDVGLAALESGTYTVVASQGDRAGNVATVSRTFVVNAAAPAVTITAPADQSTGAVRTPAFAGTAGTEAKDLSVITGALYAGTSTNGTPLTTLFGTASSGHWTALSPGAPTLADGVYTLVVSQYDNGGNVGTATSTFTVGTPPPSGPGTTPGGTGTTPSGPGTTPGGADSPLSGRVAPRLRVLSVHLQPPPGGCSRHPRPPRLAAASCAPSLSIAGWIDRRAAGQKIAIACRDRHGHVGRAAVTVDGRGRWSTRLRLPAAAQLRTWYVLVTYAGDPTLLPAATGRAAPLARGDSLG